MENDRQWSMTASWELNNYIVRPYRDVIVITNKTFSIVMY